MYCVEKLDTDLVPTSSDARAARLLTQATFGATRESIDHLKHDLNGSSERWITEQINMPATFHREYFRRNINPRQLAGNALGNLREACSVGSRWHTYAFRTVDVGIDITVLENDVNSQYKNTIIDPKGVWIELNSALSPGVYRICTVAEWRGVGGEVELSRDGCNTIETIPNPVIVLSPTSPTKVLEYIDVQMVQHESLRDVFFLKETPNSCLENATNAMLFMKKGISLVI